VSEQEAAEKAAARETPPPNVEASRANVRRLKSWSRSSASSLHSPAPSPSARWTWGTSSWPGAVASNYSIWRKRTNFVFTSACRKTSAFGIAPGQAASLTIPELPDKPFPAKVVTTSESISTTSRTLLAQLEVDNSQHRILPYSYGEVRFDETKANPALTLPSNTLLFRAEGLQVAVASSNGVVELRKVQVGRDFGQTVEIITGVTAADRVITNPSDSLVTGIKVRIQAAPNTVAAK